MSVIEESGSEASVQPVRATRLDSSSLKVTQWRVIRSEWIKLRSVRSWLVLIGAAVVVVVHQMSGDAGLDRSSSTIAP